MIRLEGIPTFAMTFKDAQQSSDWREYLIKRAEEFMEWLEVHDPHCRSWRDLNRSIARGYLASLQKKSNNTMRLYMRPLIDSVCSRAVEALQRTEVRNGERKVRTIHELLVVNLKGEPYSQYNSYSRLLKRAMGKWNKNLDIAPKDWRNVVITHAKLKGYDGSVLESYVGHSPRSISERHYFPRLTGIQTHSRGQEEMLKKVKEIFTVHVVRHLEEDVRGYYGEDGEEEVKAASWVAR